MVFDRSSPLGKVQFQSRNVITFKYKQIKKEMSLARVHRTNRPTDQQSAHVRRDRLWTSAVIIYSHLNMDI